MRQKKVVLLMALALLGLSACGSGNNASSTTTSVPASSAPTTSVPASTSSSVTPVALAAPVITLTDNVVTWTAVSHATGYDVYVNDAKLISVTALTYTVTETATGSYAIKLKAISSDTAYSESAFSNVVTYAYVAAIESVAFEVTLPAALNAGNDLYLLGSWDNYAAGVKMAVDATNTLLYTAALTTLKEQEYTYYVEINDLAKYKEAGDGTKVTPTVANPKVTHTVASFIATPEYTVTGDLTKAAYKEAEDGTITYSNTNWMDGFLLKDMPISETAYSVSAHFVGTKTSPIAADDFIGVVPYYVDSNNYVIAYACWGTDHTTMMTEVEVTGVIGGTFLDWHPTWADTSVATMPADGLTFKATRVGTTITFAFTGDNSTQNVLSGSQTFAGMTGVSKKVGVITYQDEVKMTNFACEADANHGWAGGTLTDPSETGFTFTGTDWRPGSFVLREDSVTKGASAYSVSAHIVGTKTSPISAETNIGVIPFYVDNNNYIAVYCHWVADHTTMMTEVQVTGVIGGTDLGWHDHWTDGSVATMPADGFTLKVTVNATVVSYEFTGANSTQNTASGNETFSTLTPASNAKVGIWAQNDTITVSNFATALVS